MDARKTGHLFQRLYKARIASFNAFPEVINSLRTIYLLKDYSEAYLGKKKKKWNIVFISKSQFSLYRVR